MAIDFRIRDFFYPVGILKLKYILERTQWLPPDELRAYQEKRLSFIIKQAYNHVPYYRCLFKGLKLRPSDIRRVDDLKKLPLLTKSTARDAGSDLHADNADKYHPVTYTTSGTAGSPLQFYLDKGANSLEFVYYWRHWGWAGFKLGDRFAELGSQYFLRRKNLGEVTFSWQPHLRRLMLNSGQISFCRAKEMVEAIRKYRPKFLKGMASAVYFLALSLKEAGINDISFKAIFSTGEVLTPRYRMMAEMVFSCPILDSYGHMERTVTVCQCLEGGYHINSDYGILELENIRTSANGKNVLGRVIGTSLYNMSMPFIRYDVGDHIEIFVEQRTCPCGRGLPLVKAIHGRNEDIIVTPDGRFITSIFILPEFVEGIHFVQFVQESKTELCINVVPGNKWNKEKEGELSVYVRKLVGPEVYIRIACVTSEDIIKDASGKCRTVISRVKL
jgi:phenylacetate-CoA ligase